MDSCSCAYSDVLCMHSSMHPVSLDWSSSPPPDLGTVIPGRSTSHRIASRQWEATVSPCHLCTFLWPIGADLVAHVQIPTALSIHLLSITLSQHADSRSRQIPAGRSETARPVLTRVEDVSRRCNFWVSCPGVLVCGSRGNRCGTEQARADGDTLRHPRRVGQSVCAESMPGKQGLNGRA
jgi:hypothetical protein